MFVANIAKIRTLNKDVLDSEWTLTSWRAVGKTDPCPGLANVLFARMQQPQIRDHDGERVWHVVVSTRQISTISEPC